MKRVKVPYTFESEKFISEDVLLFTQGKDLIPNVMSLTFKTIGNILGDPCINIYVSKRRFSIQLLEETEEFTLCRGGDVYLYLNNAGKYSGRDMNKIQKFEMPLEKSQHIIVPNLKTCKVSYECRIVEYAELSTIEGYKMYIGHICGVYLHV
ncbi:MAG: flavin reductase [Leptospiraceae bacterium]|nr:flavin reductase [Leptospiraceae bacterium]